MNKHFRHKSAFLTWLAIYPVITLTLWLIGEELMRIPLPVRTLVLTLVLVPLLSYIVLPLFHKLFANWLQDTKECNHE